jgi:catechol 2,3-dioxygenase-like lactoylglutathione lyase family enzyme
MIDHLEIQTHKIHETVQFYLTVLAPLGYRQMADGRAKGFGDGQRLDFFIVEGEPSRNLHFAFVALERAVVDSIYDVGRQAGFALDRPPALAPEVHPNYYAGYLRDPDGRLVEFVCHRAEYPLIPPSPV